MSISTQLQCRLCTPVSKVKCQLCITPETMLHPFPCHFFRDNHLQQYHLISYYAMQTMHGLSKPSGPSHCSPPNLLIVCPFFFIFFRTFPFSNSSKNGQSSYDHLHTIVYRSQNSTSKRMNHTHSMLLYQGRIHPCCWQTNAALRPSDKPYKYQHEQPSSPSLSLSNQTQTAGEYMQSPTFK